MSTSSWFPFVMLFLSPALISATKSRTRDSLLRLLSADLVAIGVAVGIKVIEPGDTRWIGVFYMAALAALLLTGSLLGGVLRFGIHGWYSRFVARRA
jgi:hypothetical protein